MLEPIGTRIIVKRIEARETTSSGLYIPDSERDKSQAIVVAVGDGRLLQDGTKFPLSVCVGDTVIFGRAGLEVTYKDEKYLVLDEADVVAIVRE